MSEPPPLTPAQMAAEVGDVSAEALEKLATYVDLLKKWQKAINLVGTKTLDDPWRRHILDSAQLARHLRPEDRVADLGSGAGLPGLVLAILHPVTVHMVESDQRKATFIREAARACAVEVEVHAARIEQVAPLSASVVTSRALAPLPRLLPWMLRHMAKDGRAIILKGEQVDHELTEAAKKWTMKMSRLNSLSSASGTVLVLEEIEPIHVG